MCIGDVFFLTIFVSILGTNSLRYTFKFKPDQVQYIVSYILSIDFHSHTGNIQCTHGRKNYHSPGPSLSSPVYGENLSHFAPSVPKRRAKRATKKP